MKSVKKYHFIASKFEPFLGEDTPGPPCKAHAFSTRNNTPPPPPLITKNLATALYCASYITLQLSNKKCMQTSYHKFAKNKFE